MLPNYAFVTKGEESPEDDSSFLQLSPSPPGAETKPFSRKDKDRLVSGVQTGNDVFSASSTSTSPLPNVRKMREQSPELIIKNYLNNTMTSTSRRRTSLQNKSPTTKPSSSYSRITHHLPITHSLILVFLISTFFISISTSSEVSSVSMSQSTSSSNNANNNNVNNLNSNQMGSNNATGGSGVGGNASGRNINSGIFNSNSFGGGPFSSLPISSGGGGGGNGLGNGGGNQYQLPTSTSYESTNSNSRPTAYFIAGLASQIRRINSTAMSLLTRDKPFQLQFRTVCPFGNIVNDDKFAISINSGGNMTFTTKPSDFPSSISHHSVSDGHWHSITFTGDMIFLDDHESETRYSSEDTTSTPVVHWDSNSSAEGELQSAKYNHMLHFFDGFVGCIRVRVPIHDHASNGRRQSNIQSHEESYFTPESPSEHQVISLHDLFQLRTPFTPCNDTEVELNSVHSCFNPDTFVLCSKCQNGAICRPDPTTDNPMNNQCECPPNTEEVEYSGKYCEYPPMTGLGHGHDETGAGGNNSFETENFSSDMDDSDIGQMPISSPSNIDSTSSNSSQNSELASHTGRLDNMAMLNMAEVITSTTTTEPPPQEFPFSIPSSSSDCPCNHGGECLASSTVEGQHYCNCTGTGFDGQYCSDDVNECQKFSGICNNGICQNLEGSFECFCRPGWTGKTCSKNYNECLSLPCQHNSTCHDLIDSYRCECLPGFRGTDCEQEIDECESQPCENQGQCEDRLNDFLCICLPGFEGKTCEINIDECLSGPCQHDSKCMDKINGFECDCTDTGFEGDLCQHNVDDCRIDSCYNNATCLDGVKEVICQCYGGYSGKQCELDLDECAEGPCLHGQCFQKSNQSLYEMEIDEGIRNLLPPHFSYETAAGYACLCQPGYAGINCSIDIDECALQVNACGRNGVCKDAVNSYKCECHVGYTGDKCETEINECESSPCARGECIDRIGDFSCNCPESYGAKNCSVLLTACVRDPCDKIGFAKCNAFYDEATNNHTFQCDCKEGFTGRTCSLNTVMSFNGSGPVEITNNDRNYENGNYELLFKFRTTLPDVLLIVGSGITYFYLTLSGGKLNLQSSLLNSLEGISVGQNLSNAELHKVWISVNSTHIALAADSQQTFYPIQTEDVHTGFNLTYIGGGMTNAFVNNPTKKVIKSQFIGCMQDIIINGESEVVIPDFLNSSNIEVGCKRTDQCKPNPCQNSGNCTDIWSKFTCKCLRPYLGDRCQHEYTAATFEHEATNNSLVWVEITPEIRPKFVSTFDISMFVRTRKKNGTIFLLGNEVNGNYSVYLEAEVGEIGNLVVHAKWSDAPEDPNSKLEVYAVDGLQITDGSPHLISIQREKGLVKISVNGTEHFRKSVGNRITFTPSMLYIGGKPGAVSAPPPTDPTSPNHIESRVIRSLGEDLSEQGGVGVGGEVGLLEDSTATPETPMFSVTSDGAGSGGGGIVEMRASSLENVQHEIHEEEEVLQPLVEMNEIFVANPFKGVIQDVRVNFSSNEAAPMILGHSHLQHAKIQNHYVVEFYPLEINSTYAMGEPLGAVESQNIVKGVVSDNACKINQCLNGGLCETTWNDFRCVCADGYDGRLCEFKLPCAIMTCPNLSVCHNIGWTGFECVSEVAFQGTGDVSPHYHLVSSELENITFSSISFRFRSKSPGNVLYIANGSRSFRIAFEEETDSQNQSIDSIAIYLDGVRHSAKARGILDGRWRNVSTNMMISDKDTLHLRVDSKEYKLLPAFGEVGSVPLEFLSDLIKSPNVEIVVGSHVEHRDRYSIDQTHHDEGNHVGHPEDAHNSFYRGCLDDIRLGDYRLPFVSPRQLNEINENTTLATTTAPTAFYIVESSVERNQLNLGCIVCYEEECKNSGHCTQPQESFDCTCASGFEGPRCGINVDECELYNDCRNGATCVDGVANYTCSCPAGWEGWKCDINVDECSSPDGIYICKNGGTCVDGIAQYTCICTEEYLGQNCEKRKRSSCRDDPCENGAICHDRVQHYPSDVAFQCDCAPGWEGDTCSTKIDHCKNVSCANGGSCHNKPLGYECICLIGFDGPQCEVNINDCISVPCKNNGTCEDRVNGFVCHCQHTGFEGPFCEDDINECDMPRLCPVAQMCHNLPGTFACLCPDISFCGEQCNILNPCDNQTCHNGGECKSNCYDEYNTEWMCECAGNFGGQYCELLTMAQPDRQIDILLIIIPIIAALLISATIGVVVLVRMARQKRATRGVYSPSQQEYCNPRVELDNVMKPPPEERLI